MRYIIDHDYHIHSQLSECSSHPEQTTENILKYAKKNNLKRICLTDHFWDENIKGVESSPYEWYKPQNFKHICKALPLPKDNSVEFLFGCECDFDKNFTLGISKEKFDEFDFVIIPTTHLHMSGFTLDENCTIEERAALWSIRFKKLLEHDLPWHKIGIAHLACSAITASTREDYIKALNAIPSDKMYELFTKTANLGAGIEINRADMQFTLNEADTVLRMFRIAKECGCKFYLGSDSHNPKDFNGAINSFERAIEHLGLTEDDKFYITK